MGAVLDVVALRSMVAVADCGGFHRAAAALCLTQSADSQHLRKLERVLDRKLVVREGRQAKFTPAGELLLAEARRILDAHDEALRRLGAEERRTLVFGSTEHAADRLLPEMATRMRAAFPVHEVRFRLDRTARLAESVDRGSIDIALLIGRSVAAVGTRASSGWTGTRRRTGRRRAPTSRCRWSSSTSRASCGGSQWTR